VLEGSALGGSRPRPRWREPVGWKNYGRLLRLVQKLEGYHSTRDVLLAAGLGNDPRGGVGGLHAASALGLCHARSGGRRSLVWGPGARPSQETPPRLARQEEYRRVIAVLRKSPRAAFATAVLQEVAGGRTRQELVGALKLLVAADLVVHVVMRPWTRRYGISCWGWHSPEIRDADRYYRGGLQPKPPLSIDVISGAGLTVVDREVANRDL
jgi:hypothetical protein